MRGEASAGPSGSRFRSEISIYLRVLCPAQLHASVLILRQVAKGRSEPPPSDWHDFDRLDRFMRQMDSFSKVLERHDFTTTRHRSPYSPRHSHGGTRRSTAPIDSGTELLDEDKAVQQIRITCLFIKNRAARQLRCRRPLAP